LIRRGFVLQAFGENADSLTKVFRKDRTISLEEKITSTISLEEKITRYTNMDQYLNINKEGEEIREVTELLRQLRM